MRKKRSTLVLKLAGAFFLLSLAAVSLVGYAIYARSGAILERMVSDRLRTAAELKKVELDNWVRSTLRDARYFTDLGSVTANLEKWSEVKDSPASTIWSVDFSPDGTRLATGGADHTAHVWNLETGQEEHSLAHPNIVSMVRFLDTDRYLLSKDYENIVRVWDLESEQPVFSLRLAHLLDFSGPDPDRTMAVSTWKPETLLWRVRDLTRQAEPFLTMPGFSSWAALSPDANLLCVADDKGRATLYRLDPASEARNEPQKALAVIQGGDAGLAFSPDGHWLASANKEGGVFVYSLEQNGQDAHPVLASTASVPSGDERRFAFSPDSRWLGVFNDGRSSFDLLGLVPQGPDHAWRVVLNLEPVYGFAFAPGDRPLLLTAMEDEGTALWDLSHTDSQGAPARRNFITETEGGAEAVFSRDGSLLSIAAWNGRVQAYSVAEALQTGEPENLAAPGMMHAPLPVELLGQALQTRVDSSPEWESALLLDVDNEPVATALGQHQNPDHMLGLVLDQASLPLEQPLVRAVFSEDRQRPGLLLLAPVSGENGEHLGTLACLLNLSVVDRILSLHTGVGKNGELYLVNSGRLIGDSRSRSPQAPDLESALAEHPVDEAYSNFSGDPVFGVSLPLDSLDWTLVAEIPTSEALAPARALAWTALVAGSLLILLLLGAGYFLSRKIALPIMAAAEMAKEIVSGHVDPNAESLDGDEARVLSAAFHRMLPALEERIQILQALDIANEVQANLLPSEPPRVQGLDIAGLCDFCEATGGDYFDYIPTAWPRDEGLAVVVGDVTGHGVPAALLMTSLRAFLRQRTAMAQAAPDNAASVVTDANAQLARDVHLSGRFATLFYLDIHRPSSSIRWVRAGHDPALVFDPADGSFSQLEGTGVPLGVLEDFSYEEQTAAIRPGQIIVIGTDGVWEARNSEGELFGKDRLKTIIRDTARLPAQGLVQAVADAVRAHQGDSSQARENADDLTLVVVKVTDIS